ncbi:MAG: STAS/SEC14 domain-containing protein [Chloroflexota bacterium]
MPAATTWYQENRVVLVHVQGELTLDDMVAVDRKIVELVRAGSQATPLIHLIVDMRAMTKMPINLAQVHRTLTHLKEPALGWSVMVGMSPVMRWVASTVIQMAGARFRMFPTAEEAVSFLISQDESIIDLERQPL